MRSALSNAHHGEIDGFEVVDVIFTTLSIFSKDQCPTIPALCDFVTRAGYPRPSEVKRVEHRDRGIYRLYIQREPCPVVFFGGSTCPICGGDHESYSD